MIVTKMQYCRYIISEISKEFFLNGVTSIMPATILIVEDEPAIQELISYHLRTADLTALFVDQVGETGQVWLTDINNSMLAIGRDRMLNEGIAVPVAQCDAEKLPFPDNFFDHVNVAFGLRNMTHKDIALKEMLRVLCPGGSLTVLEFSKVWKPLQPFYDTYSFKVLPLMGKLIARDEGSYRYLAESIRMHPSQDELKQLMQQVGFERVEYFNLAAGVVALHRGYKF